MGYHSFCFVFLVSSFFFFFYYYCSCCDDQKKKERNKNNLKGKHLLRFCRRKLRFREMVEPPPGTPWNFPPWVGGCVPERVRVGAKRMGAHSAPSWCPKGLAFVEACDSFSLAECFFFGGKLDPLEAEANATRAPSTTGDG